MCIAVPGGYIDIYWLMVAHAYAVVLKFLKMCALVKEKNDTFVVVLMSSP